MLAGVGVFYYRRRSADSKLQAQLQTTKSKATDRDVEMSPTIIATLKFKNLKLEKSPTVGGEL